MTKTATRQMKSVESREQYLKAAKAYCKRRFDYHCEQDPWCHESHNVAKAMADTEKRFVDMGTFGVEGDCEENGEGCIDIQYLNTGDSYELTIVHWKGRFILSSWGDIAERYAH